MDTLKHIAAALSSSGGDDHVYQAGRTISETLGANLSVVSVLPPPLQIDRGLATLEIEFDVEDFKQVNAAVKQRCHALGVQSENIHILRGGKSSASAEWANANKVDLICVGIHSKVGLDHFLGTTATGLLRHAEGAVLGCHPNQPLRFENILLAIEIDEHLTPLLKQTKALIKHTSQAKIHVLNVMHPIDPYVSKLNANLAHSFMGQARTARENDISKQFSAAQLRYTDLEVRVGVPSSVIKEQAEMLGVDLIIMNTGRHLGFGWHVGSTTNNVMHGVKTNVLALR